MNTALSNSSMQKRQSREQLNTFVLDGMAIAKRCADKLADFGFTVLEIKVSGRNPRVKIATSPRAESLPGVTYITRMVHGVRENVKVASFCGCQVEWTERGN